MAEDRDPGWKPAFRRWPMFFLPLPTITFPVLQRRGKLDGLTILRILWLSSVTTLLLGLLVILMIEREVGIPDDWYVGLFLPLQVLSLAGVGYWRSRPLETADGTRLAASYQRLFLVGVAFADSAALVGFVGVFVLRELWPYLVGLGVALIGLALMAPSRREMERCQQELRAHGLSLSLTAALFENPLLGQT